MTSSKVLSAPGPIGPRVADSRGFTGGSAAHGHQVQARYTRIGSVTARQQRSGPQPLNNGSKPISPTRDDEYGDEKQSSQDPRCGWNMFGRGAMWIRRPPMSGDQTLMGSPKFIKGSRYTPWFPQPLRSSYQSFSPASLTSGLAPLLSVASHDTPNHHVLQNHSHLPHHRRYLRQRLNRPGCPFPRS